MKDHTIHEGHDHAHGPGCGHKTVEHDGHRDYLHDGHLHHVHGDHVDEHALAVDAKNPAACTSGHPCTGHEATHLHTPLCGHEPIQHGDHVDFIVDGHLHHAHDGHCDDHGPVKVSR